MKSLLHPYYELSQVTCSCGNNFLTRSSKAEVRVEVCSACHPFYTGKQKVMDSGGRIERFERKINQARKLAR